MANRIETSPGSVADLPAWLETVRLQVARLHYGEVQIVVHDDRVVQIERRERVRLTAPPASLNPAGFRQAPSAP